MIALLSPRVLREESSLGHLADVYMADQSRSRTDNEFQERFGNKYKIAFDDAFGKENTAGALTIAAEVLLISMQKYFNGNEPEPSERTVSALSHVITPESACSPSRA